MCNVLPALHALTGCDTTSRVSNKKQALSIAGLDFVQNALSPLGNGEILNAQKLQNLEEVCTYLVSKSRTTADSLRHKYILQNLGFSLNLSRIICTSDALNLHFLRTDAQVYLWKNATKPMFETINFQEFGYEARDGTLYPRQMNKEPLPQSLIKPCKCKSTCRTMSCSCKKSSLACIQLCKCESDECKNFE